LAPIEVHPPTGRPAGSAHYDRGVRVAFVHQAVLELAPGADQQAPGAAVTVELCGHWDHDGPCRWPHHTASDPQSGERLAIRTVFVSDPAEEPDVRRRIGKALLTGRLEGPAGLSRWTVDHQGADEPSSPELALGTRLTGS